MELLYNLNEKNKEGMHMLDKLKNKIQKIGGGTLII